MIMDLPASISLAWLTSAFAFAVAMSATPGPNNAMVAASGATFGFARTWPHILGISLGFPLMVIAVAVGANGILHRYPQIHTVLKWLGAAYLLWLAWKIGSARPVGLVNGAPGRQRPITFIQALLFQWVNPKAWVIAVGAIATYTDPGNGALIVQVAILAVMFLLVCIPATALWTGIGAGAARVLRTPTGLRLFNLTMAGLLIASLIPLLAGE